jgi:hypothetical protein
MILKKVSSFLGFELVTSGLKYCRLELRVLAFTGRELAREAAE